MDWSPAGTLSSDAGYQTFSLAHHEYPYEIDYYHFLDGVRSRCSHQHYTFM